MTATPATPQRGFLAFVERIGNKLPEPAMIFVWLIGALVVISVIAQWLGWSASLPYSGKEAPEWGVLEGGVLVYRATSLLTEENIARLLTEMPKTYTSFAPLGLVMTVMLGAAVAEQSGLFSAAIRGALGSARGTFLTPLIAVIGILCHNGSDAAGLVFMPLAAIVFAAAGRHPLAGLAAAFAAVTGGISANFAPTQLDVLLFGFTQEAARIVEPGWTMNPAGNWFIGLATATIMVPTIWFLTDRVVEPRLGRWSGAGDGSIAAELERAALTSDERRGLKRAGLVLLAIALVVAALVFTPGYSPLHDESKTGPGAMQPFFGSMIAVFLMVFLLPALAYGRTTGTIRSTSEMIEMMEYGIRNLAPYIVVVFFTAHFVAMFNWSRLGPILAIEGAEAIKAIGLPAPLLLVSVLLMSSVLDLFIGSASAKWSALSPVVVPMFMLLGISPEMTTAAYRAGDSYTNIMTPLMSYFPLILGFARRWAPDYGVGSMLALMLPFGLAFMAISMSLVVGWVAFDLPLGPGAQVFYARSVGG